MNVSKLGHLWFRYFLAPVFGPELLTVYIKENEIKNVIYKNVAVWPQYV